MKEQDAEVWLHWTNQRTGCRGVTDAECPKVCHLLQGPQIAYLGYKYNWLVQQMANVTILGKAWWANLHSDEIFQMLSLRWHKVYILHWPLWNEIFTLEHAENIPRLCKLTFSCGYRKHPSKPNKCLQNLGPHSIHSTVFVLELTLLTPRPFIASRTFTNEAIDKILTFSSLLAWRWGTLVYFCKKTTTQI